MTTCQPMLTFPRGGCAEALALYADVLPGFELLHAQRTDAGGVVTAVFRVGDATVMAADGDHDGTSHDWDFSPAVSLVLSVDDAPAVDALHDGFVSAGGSTLMPPGDYGFSERFAWVADPWGVSWQATTVIG